MIANLSALTAARERAVPGARVEGLGTRRATLLCSAEAHGSVQRAAEILGIGSANVHAIPVDARGCMDVADCAATLDADLAAGRVPVAVVATAGTTLTGAVDDIAALADLCAGHDVWLHVDGAYGLPAAATTTAASAVRGTGASRLGDRRRPQVALRAQGLQRAAHPRPRRAAVRLRPRRRLPPADPGR